MLCLTTSTNLDLRLQSLKKCKKKQKKSLSSKFVVVQEINNVSSYFGLWKKNLAATEGDMFVRHIYISMNLSILLSFDECVAKKENEITERDFYGIYYVRKTKMLNCDWSDVDECIMNILTNWHETCGM